MLRSTSFETAIMEPYRRWESGVEEILIEIHLAGVWMGLPKALWGGEVSPAP